VCNQDCSLEELRASLGNKKFCLLEVVAPNDFYSGFQIIVPINFNSITAENILHVFGTFLNNN
jgi:hypothetical protein